jgi:hypothetical protein
MMFESYCFPTADKPSRPETNTQKGLAQAGNARVRGGMIQLAWRRRCDGAD